MIAKESIAPTAQTFRLRTALLKQGRTTNFIAACENADRGMSIAMKCYAEGGENEFHAHTDEDHTFIVLQGRAVFHQPGLPDQELGRNEGILLPTGASYKFEAVPGEPLVLLRVGNRYFPVDGTEERKGPEARFGLDGKPLPAYSAANKHVTGVPIEGAFYE